MPLQEHDTIVSAALPCSSGDVFATSGKDHEVALDSVVPVRHAAPRQAVPVPPALSALFGQAGKKENGKDPAELIHKQTVSAWLDGFVTSQTSQAPKSVGQVLEDLGDVWANGFLPPHTTSLALIRRYSPDMPEKALEIVQNELNQRYNEKEPLTGAHRKQHEPLLTGLAHLYGVLMEKPVTLVIGDFSNMRGTNEHFRKIMAAAEKKDVTDIPLAEAEKRTDKAVRAVSTLIQEQLKLGASKKQVDFFCHRTGGDEFQIVFAGLDEKATNALLDSCVKPAVEEMTAKTGLHRHEHSKERDDPWSRGFGIAFSTIALGQTTQPGLALAKADSAMQEEKARIGNNRIGALGHLRPVPGLSELPPDAVSPPRRDLLQPNGNLAGLTNIELLEKAAEQAEIAAQLAEEYRKTGKKILKGKELKYPQQQSRFDQPGDERSTEPHVFRCKQEKSAALAREVLNHFDGTVAPKKIRSRKFQPEESDHAPPSLGLFLTPGERTIRRVLAAMKAGSVTLDPGQAKLVQHVLSNSDAVDPATGAYMGDQMPAIFGVFAQDTASLRLSLAETPENEQAEVKNTLENQSPDTLQSYSFAAAMHNLAGVNQLLGHKNANHVLHHFATLLNQSIRKAGINPDYTETGHDGGGLFITALRPLVSFNDILRPARPGHLHRIHQNLARKVRDFNKTQIGDFLAQNDGTIPDGLDPDMTFGQIADPRRPEYPGVDLTVSLMRLSQTDDKGEKISGGRNYAALKAKIFAKIDRKREKRLTESLQP